MKTLATDVNDCQGFGHRAQPFCGLSAFSIGSGQDGQEMRLIYFGPGDSPGGDAGADLPRPFYALLAFGEFPAAQNGTP